MAIPTWYCGSCEREFTPNIKDKNMFNCPNCGSTLTKPLRKPSQWEDDSNNL